MLRDLRCDLSDTAGGGRHQHLFAGTDRADIAHPEIRGHSAESERADPRQRIAARHIDLLQVLRRQRRMRLPAEPRLHQLTGRKVAGPAFQHARDTAAAHDVAQRAPHRCIQDRIAGSIDSSSVSSSTSSGAGRRTGTLSATKFSGVGIPVGRECSRMRWLIAGHRRAHHLGDAFGDHDGGDVGVGARNLRHHRRIRDEQVVRAPTTLPPRIHHGSRIGRIAHPAGAGGMPGGLHVVAHMTLQRGGIGEQFRQRRGNR